MPVSHRLPRALVAAVTVDPSASSSSWITELGIRQALCIIFFNSGGEWPARGDK
jgi:hypothetical protein